MILLILLYLLGCLAYLVASAWYNKYYDGEIVNWGPSFILFSWAAVLGVGMSFIATGGFDKVILPLYRWIYNKV